MAKPSRPCLTARVKVGLQFKRRFWEQDEHIYGGITYTDLPIGQISYPSSRFFSEGKGVLLGAYIWDMGNSMHFTSMSPAERVAKAVEYGSQIHPQYTKEFDNGVGVAWHRVPSAHGLLRSVERCSARAALRQSLRISTAASSSPANTPRICRPGRKAP